MSKKLWFAQGDGGCEVSSSISATPATSPYIIIKILTFDRPASLNRLLESLTAAHYQGDQVSLEIRIDRSQDGSQSPGWNEVSPPPFSFL